MTFKEQLEKRLDNLESMRENYSGDLLESFESPPNETRAEYQVTLHHNYVVFSTRIFELKAILDLLDSEETLSD